MLNSHEIPCLQGHLGNIAFPELLDNSELLAITAMCNTSGFSGMRDTSPSIPGFPESAISVLLLCFWCGCKKCHIVRKPYFIAKILLFALNYGLLRNGSKECKECTTWPGNSRTNKFSHTESLALYIIREGNCLRLKTWFMTHYHTLQLKPLINSIIFKNT